MYAGKEAFWVGGESVAAVLAAEMIGFSVVNVTRLAYRRIDCHTADGIDSRVGGDVFRVCGQGRYPEAVSVI